MEFDRKKHWENIYQTKALEEVSWFEPKAETSLNFFDELHIDKNSKIIDMGGGDSYLVDHLLERGYNNITVLDISESALTRAKARLGDLSNKVKWVVADAAHFQPKEKYDVWHDRAAFHFLTEEKEIENYIHTVKENMNPGGKIIVGTFSEDGPKKCSGIEIKQYSEGSISNIFERFFQKIKCMLVDHKTPFDTVQNFIFCSFKVPENNLT